MARMKTTEVDVNAPFTDDELERLPKWAQPKVLNLQHTLTAALEIAAAFTGQAFPPSDPGPTLHGPDGELDAARAVYDPATSGPLSGPNHTPLPETRVLFVPYEAEAVTPKSAIAEAASHLIFRPTEIQAADAAGLTTTAYQCPVCKWTDGQAEDVQKHIAAHYYDHGTPQS